MERRIPLAAVLVLLLSFGCQSAEYRQAKKLFEAGMYEEALERLDEEIANRPENSKAYILIGHCCLGLFRDSGSQSMWEQAQVSFARGFRLNNSEANREEIVQAYIRLGKEQLESRGPYSVRAFQHAVRVDLQKKFEIARYLLEHQERSVCEDEERYVEACDAGLLVLATIYDVSLKERAVALYLDRLRNCLTADVIWKNAADPESLEVETKYERAIDCYRTRCSEMNPACEQMFFGLLVERAKRSYAEGDARSALFFTSVASSHTAEKDGRIIAGLLTDIGTLAAERDEAGLSLEALRRARELGPSHDEAVETTSY